MTQVGQKEQPAGSNRGPMVDKYQEADGLTNPNYGYAWCASFINWCYKRAGRSLKELGISASVGVLLSKARSLGWVHNDPRVDSLVCYDWDTLTGPGKHDWPDHIGIVISVGTGGNFKAVEGNTAIGNDSNGGQVMVRDRHISQVEGFIRVPGGYEILRRYRIERDGKSVAILGLVRTIARVTRILRDLTRGHNVKVTRIGTRKELPNA